MGIDIAVNPARQLAGRLAVRRHKNKRCEFNAEVVADFFCLKDLTWYNAPDNIYARNFMSDEFDILLDLNLNDLFPLRYISALSKANFKVGKRSDRNNSIFDLMIETDEKKGVKYFLKNIDTYLFIINKKHDKFVTADE